MAKIQQRKDGVAWAHIPPSILRAKGWKKGDSLDFFLDARTGDVFLKKTNTSETLKKQEVV